MFDSLDEQIKLDEHKGESGQQRLVRNIIIIAISVVVVVAGLYAGLRILQAL